VGGILRGLRRAAPEAVQVVVSGGPAIPAGLIPEDADLVQLPTLVPTVGLFSSVAPRAAHLPSATARKMRRRMLGGLVRELRPDVVLVEHYPFGRHAFAREIAGVLDEIAARFPSCAIVGSLAVLGGRAPEHLREEMVLEAARRHFHRILVHTDPAIERIEEDYPLAAIALAPLVRYTGYVLPTPLGELPPREMTRLSLGLSPREPLVVAHAGGGRDGAAVLRLALETVRRLGRGLFRRRVRWLLVAGSAMPPSELVDLEALARGLPAVRLERHRPELFAWVAAADAVVSMAGYATAAEILAAGTPALFVPRRTDNEQVRRASRLEALGAGVVLPEGAGAREAAGLVEKLLSGGRPRIAVPALDGAARAASEILSVRPASAAQAALEGIP
jgi:predicted glycosyltransferase